MHRKPVLSGMAVLALFSVSCALMASASAAPNKPTDVPATVIAHLPLPQATGNQMLLQKEEGKLIYMCSRLPNRASWLWM